MLWEWICTKLGRVLTSYLCSIWPKTFEDRLFPSLVADSVGDKTPLKITYLAQYKVGNISEITPEENPINLRYHPAHPSPVHHPSVSQSYFPAAYSLQRLLSEAIPQLLSYPMLCALLHLLRHC